MTLKGITKLHGKKRREDKFYTAEHIAELCLSKLDLGAYSVRIEPSAGAGVFSNRVPECVAFDIAPEHDSITKQDWLEYNRERTNVERVLVVGNPPFGVQNNLAIKFVNHSASFADTIAFILPRSFRKESIQAKLHPNLHLREEIILPKNSFVLLGEAYDLPAVFQIWDYDETRVRAKPVKHPHEGFDFVKKEESPDFAVQRIGGRSGQASSNWQAKNIQSHYFVKLENEAIKEQVVASINSHEFLTRYDSAGPRSISKNEFAPVLNRAIRENK